MGAYGTDIEKSIETIEAAWKVKHQDDALAFSTANTMFGDVQGMVSKFATLLSNDRFPFLNPGIALTPWTRDGNTVSAHIELTSSKKVKVAVPLRTLIGEPMVTVGDRSFPVEQREKIMTVAQEEIVAFFLP